MATGKAGEHHQSPAFRKLHRRITKWAKKMSHEWEIISGKSGWKYKLNGEVVAATHPRTELGRAFKGDLRRAGIPRDVIGIVMPGSLSGWELQDGDTPHDKSLETNLRDAQTGELLWWRGHNVLVVGRVEQPDITKRCSNCEGDGNDKEYFAEMEDEWRYNLEHEPSQDEIEEKMMSDEVEEEWDRDCECVGIGVIVQFLPNGLDRYEHQFPPYDVEANRQKVESWTQR